LLKYSIIWGKKKENKGPTSNPNLIFSTNFAAIFYYFKKWVLQANPNLIFSTNFAAIFYYFEKWVLQAIPI
jgi:hypothetical protein